VYSPLLHAPQVATSGLACIAGRLSGADVVCCSRSIHMVRVHATPGGLRVQQQRWLRPQQQQEKQEQQSLQDKRCCRHSSHCKTSGAADTAVTARQAVLPTQQGSRPAALLQSEQCAPPLPARLPPSVPLRRSFFSRRHKRERAVLAGCAVGADAPAVAVPLIEALAGPAGVVAACSALVANSLSGKWRFAYPVCDWIGRGAEGLRGNLLGAVWLVCCC
jgi:hypothetical protein